MKTVLVIFLMLLIAFNSNGQVADTCHILDHKKHWSDTREDFRLYAVQQYAKKHMRSKEQYHMKAMKYAKNYSSHMVVSYTGIIAGSLLTVTGILAATDANKTPTYISHSPSGYSYSSAEPVNTGVVAACIGVATLGIVFTVLGGHHLHKVRMTMEGNCITFPLHRNKVVHQENY